MSKSLSKPNVLFFHHVYALLLNESQVEMSYFDYPSRNTFGENINCNN